MRKIDENTIGYRIRTLRKQKGYNQQQLADILNKSLRTIQKYETGEIEISLSMINELAKVLGTTSTYLLGYDIKTEPNGLNCMADVMGFLFELEKITDLKFDIEVKRPPRNAEWECSIKFGGKAADLNADMCLFLEDWADMLEDLRSGTLSKEKYEKWQDQTLAYYSGVAVKRTDTEDSAIKVKIPPEDLLHI